MNDKVNWHGVDVHLEEGQRQMTLLALAKLSIERPGWTWALEQIALKMDNVDGENAVTFRAFIQLHSEDDPPGVRG